MRKLFLVGLICGLSVALTACNTVRGVGKDLESAANTVDKAI